MRSAHSSKKMVILAITTGNILEWYEFALFLLLAPKISTLFFPVGDSGQASLVNILLIFFVGCLSRPIGGIFFGYIGDRYGRRLALISSITFITIPTFLISFIPTYTQIGYAAPILLCFLRFLQGFPLGGEFPGSMCYLMENAAPTERGFMSSFAFFGASIGILFIIIEAFLMSYFLTNEQILSWGWRFSFFLGGLIGLTGLLLRFKLNETPLFEVLEKKNEVIKAPLYKVLKNYKKSILYVILVAAFPLSSLYSIFIYTEIYIDNSIINGLFLLESIIVIPSIGLLNKRMQIKKVLLGSATLVALLYLSLYIISKTPHLPIILFIEFIIVALACVHLSMICQSISGLFPTKVRFTGLAIGYNICSAFLAGSIPFLSLVLIQKTHGFISTPIIMMILTAVTFIGILPLKEKEGLLVFDQPTKDS